MYEGNLTKNNDTFKESSIMPLESMVAEQCEDGGSRICGTV